MSPTQRTARMLDLAYEILVEIEYYHEYNCCFGCGEDIDGYAQRLPKRRGHADDCPWLEVVLSRFYPTDESPR